MSDRPGSATTLREATAPEGVTIEPPAGSVPELFQRTAARRGGAPAMFSKVGGAYTSIDWNEYARRVKAIAGYLLSDGFEHGQRAGILSFNRAEWNISDLGIMHTGGCAVGIYQTNSAPQCQYIIEHAEAPIVFVENREQLDKILEVKSELPRLKRVVVFSGEIEDTAGDLVISWDEALRRGEAYNTEHPEEFEARWKAVGLDDLATFIYTSGTTGPPKAVMLDHRNMMFTVAVIATYVHGDEAHPENEFSISYLPLAHIAERMAGQILHLLYGSNLYFAEDLAHLAPDIKACRPTFAFGVPRIWERFQQAVQKQIDSTTGLKAVLSRWALAQGDRSVDARVAGGSGGLGYKVADRLVLSKIREALGMDRMRLMQSGAAPISPKTLRFFWAIGLRLMEGYGLSETTGPTSTTRPGWVKLGTVGPPAAGITVRIADDGEVLIKGGNIFKGYFKNEAGTAEVLDADGWFHSGDVGVIDADGFLTITDRKKDLIITAGGKNISPNNIEMALKKAVPFAGQAVAIGDARPFMAALLTIDAEQVAALASEVGEPADMAALAKSEKVRQIFQQGVDAVNANLSHVEAIKKFTILPTDLSIDGGELTPTLKVKRKVVNEKYAGYIEGLYSSKPNS